MIKGFKVRLFPTPKQEEKLMDNVHACRFFWNWMVAYQEEYYKNGGRFLSKFSMIKLITKLRNTEEYKWMQSFSSRLFADICGDLDFAYNRFFKKLSKGPNFKKKRTAKKSFPTRYDRMRFCNGCVHLEKIGNIKVKSNYEMMFEKQHKFINPRVSFDNGKWILSFALECENQTFKLTDNALGIDLGVKKLAVVSFGKRVLQYDNINKSRRVKKLKSKMKHIQRVIDRKYRVGNELHPSRKWLKSNNILKYEDLLKKIQRKLNNIRLDYIHKITHELVAMKPKVIGMEDLNVSGMIKNAHLSKVISEQYFYEFIRQMKYKSEWYGIKFVQVPRFFPSSKSCSHCGEIKKDLKLSERIFICPHCGQEIDRDLNAAINLKMYAVSTLETTA